MEGEREREREGREREGGGDIIDCMLTINTVHTDLYHVELEFALVWALAMNFDPPLLKLEQFVTGAANGSRRSLVHHTSLVLVAEVERSNTCEVCACVCVHVCVCAPVETWDVQFGGQASRSQRFDDFWLSHQQHSTASYRLTVS